MPADFERAIEYVLRNEGGYKSNPNDKGGETNFGITQNLLDKFSPGASVSLLTEDGAKAVYKKFFWDPLNLSQLPQQIATAILDTAVNQGQNSAVRYAQQAAGMSKIDGVLGSETRAALNIVDANSFIYSYVGYIQDKYTDIVKAAPSQIEFLKGWLRRSRKLFMLMSFADYSGTKTSVLHQVDYN